MTVIWSETAKRNYKQNIKYLLDEWSYSVMKEFILELDETVKRLKIHQELGAFDEQIGSHKILVVKQIYLFYEVKNGNLYILDVWNNYKKPFWN